MTMNNTLYFLLLVIHYVLILCSAMLAQRKRNLEKNSKHYFFYLLCIALALLVAFRPTEIIPDAYAYHDRYYLSPQITSLQGIIESKSFYRGSAYNMSKFVSILFYVFYEFKFPYELFVFVIALVELNIFFVYTRKICEELDMCYNEYLLFLILLLFYGYRYQFIVFAQGMGMCLIAPILYYLIKKSYFRMVIITGITLLFHVAEFYIVAIVLIYIFTPKMKDRAYTIIWLIVGFLQFTGIAYQIGGNLTGFAGVFIERIVSDSLVYTGYGSGDSAFVISISGVVLWIYYGLMIFSYNKKVEYWRFLNVVLISTLISSILARWHIVHRFTDNSKMLLPILTMLYYYNSQSKVILNSRNIKVLILFVIAVLEFISNIRLLGFL